MKKALPIVLIGIALSFAIVTMSQSIRKQNQRRTDNPAVSNKASEHVSNNHVESEPSKVVEDEFVPTKEEVSTMFSETTIAKTFHIPGKIGFLPGPVVSRVLFPKSLYGGVPEKESDAGWSLYINNRTGEIVAAPDEPFTPLQLEEAVRMALSDIKEEELRNYYKSLKTNLVQVPGLAVVTFSEQATSAIDDDLISSQPFVLRVWINAKEQSVYCGEMGN